MKAEVFLSPEPAPVIDLRRIESTLMLDHFRPETYDIPPEVLAKIEALNLSPPYTPPRQSRATRFINLRSRGSQRGALRAAFNGIDRMIVFESLLELHTLHMLMSDTAVIDVWDQPPPIVFRNILGKWTDHTLDYLVLYSDGNQIGYAVKPRRQVVNEDGGPSDFARNMRRVRTAAGFPIRIVTEQSFSAIQVQDARTLHRYHRQTDAEADAMVRDVIGSLNGAFQVRTIRDLSGLEGRAFGAVVRAYRAGLLVKAERRRLDIDTLVERARHVH